MIDHIDITEFGQYEIMCDECEVGGAFDTRADAELAKDNHNKMYHGQ